MAIGNNRPTIITLNSNALIHNIDIAKEQFDNDINVFAVVKANAYGHGIKEIVQIAKEAKVNGFAVAILDEALEIRELGYEQDTILVLGITTVEYVMLAALNGISLTVGSLEWLKKAKEILDNPEIPPLKIHLAIDTGMGRIGVQSNDELTEMVKYLKDYPHAFIFEGIFTHFATADSKNEDYFKMQVNNWNDALKLVNPLPKFVHAANSAASIWHAGQFKTNVLRLGAGMYGFNPSGNELLTDKLQPVLSLSTELVFVKQVQKGKSISYGATYQTKENEWIGTLPIGYADGYLRIMQGYKVLIDGQQAPIIGRVTMDQIMIKLPKKYPIGTKVTLIGQDDENELSVVDLANYANTIPYEITTNLSTRIKREVK